MYGKWVRVDLGDGIACMVWVNCSPSDTEQELQRRAMKILTRRMKELAA